MFSGFLRGKQQQGESDFVSTSRPTSTRLRLRQLRPVRQSHQRKNTSGN